MKKPLKPSDAYHSGRSRTLRIALLSLLSVLIAAICGFFLWASDYYHADSTALAAMQQDSSIRTIRNMT
ncbi:MAG: hypothetical protein EOM64_04600, partial [Erysipelotrichia bacterium]|nr:hypothetical protein [Erysipelotrichia bacterium]